ncbi:hypothetical protein pb186bvf_002641 [Paramecium bursaria]
MINDNPFYQQYEILGFLGQGAQGQVELCKKRSTGQLFAVKKMSGDINYLQNELDIQTFVQSKYIVKMIEFMCHEGILYRILEYCNGQTLFQKAQNQSFSENDIYEFLTFILWAQFDLIQMGIIHRDLKLNNILIHDGQYKLADFGISRLVYNHEQQQQLTQFQKSTYRSPQMQRGLYSSKCDVWSIGIIIYYLLFKQYPWNLDNQNKQQYYNDCKNLTFPQHRTISDNMKELIEGCLAYEESINLQIFVIEDRYSWTDLMKTKNLMFEFHEYERLEQNLKQIELQLVQNIILSIIQNQTTAQSLFESDHREYAPYFRVNFIAFQKSIRKYDQSLQKFHIVYLFNQIDQNHKKYIDHVKFEEWIKRCEGMYQKKQNSQIQDEPFPLLSKINNNNDRLKMKQLFIIIYVYIQQYGYNIQKFVDKHECLSNNIKMGYIQKSQLVDLFKEIDKNINQDYIQIAKKYITQEEHINNDKLANIIMLFRMLIQSN